MHFFSRWPGEWVVQFLEPDGQTSVGRIRVFRSLDTVRAILARTPPRSPTETRALEDSFHKGVGAVWLELTDEQYRTLRGH